MARNENPPFPRGSTFWNGDTTQINTTDGFQYEGQEWEFEDEDFTNGTIGAQPYRSNRRVRCRVVRNVSGGTLAAKNIVALNTNGTGTPTSGQVIGQVKGLAAANEKGYPVDEWLTATVVANDLFYIVVDGYAKITTAGSGNTTISVGGAVVCGGAGVAVAIDTTQTGANLYNQILNTIGTAITATTGTGQDFIVDVGGAIHH